MQLKVLTNFIIFHNGGNDSYIRQSQLWDQIICQTKTAKNFLWNWLVILMPCNSLTNFEFEEEEFCCNLAKIHPYFRWSWERTIDSIRWCYKNQIGIKKSGPIGPVCLLSWFLDWKLCIWCYWNCLSKNFFCQIVVSSL